MSPLHDDQDPARPGTPPAETDAKGHQTLVFAFTIDRLDEPQFHEFMKRLFEAQRGIDLGLCKFDLYDEDLRALFDLLDRPPQCAKCGESCLFGC